MDDSADTAISPSTFHPTRRLFSLPQANRSLVLVSRIVADLVADYSRLLEAQDILELEQRYGCLDYLDEVRRQMAATVRRLQHHLEELEGVGVVLRDFASGLVDFPARVAGRDVYFCWQFGEEGIQYWHGRYEGLTGRKPVSELARPAAVRPPLPR